jgi:hypothetical protein
MWIQPRHRENWKNQKNPKHLGIRLNCRECQNTLIDIETYEDVRREKETAVYRMSSLQRKRLNGKSDKEQVRDINHKETSREHKMKTKFNKQAESKKGEQSRKVEVF